MDITETLIPKSDQLNSEDLLTGARIVTVEKVTAGSAEQPVNIHLVEFPGRPFRPSKTVRRIIAKAWGIETSAYTGRRMKIYTDPEVRFGGQAVGGIRIQAISHIDKRMDLALTATRGKKALFRVEPLPAGPPLITDDQAAEFATAITNAADRAALSTISAQLKTFDLGAHKDDLLGLGKSRMAELAKPAAEAEATK